MENPTEGEENIKAESHGSSEDSFRSSEHDHKHGLVLQPSADSPPVPHDVYGSESVSTPQTESAAPPPPPAPHVPPLPPAQPDPVAYSTPIQNPAMVAGPSYSPVPPVPPTQPPAAHELTNPVTIILQWLTYAFWGWTVLNLSMLTYVVIGQLLNQHTASNFNYYVCAALIILLPCAVVCDYFYSKREPQKKVNAAMVVMVIHAVLFAIIGIGSVLFAAFSFVRIFTSSTSKGIWVAALISSLVIGIYYALTFIRTLNFAKIPSIAKTYKIVMAVLVIIFLILGFTKPHLGTLGRSNLLPTAVGAGECDAEANYAQIAIAGGATCTTAADVINDAKAGGASYTSNGYTCKSTSESSSGNNQWASYWDGTFYAYSCADGNNQIAFNWQPADNSTSSSSPSPSSSTPTVTVGGSGALQPTLPGDGECGAAANYAQIAISGGATCTTAESVVAAATGSNFSSNGYSCTATKEGSNTQWSSYWEGDFYAYTCADGSSQIAFNWQSPTATNSEPN